MNELIDSILLLHPAARLLIFSIVVSALTTVAVSTRWKNLPRYRSFALVGAFSLLLASPLLTFFCYEASIGLKIDRPTTAPSDLVAAVSVTAPVEFGTTAPAPTPVPLEATAVAPDLAIDFVFFLELFVACWFFGTVALLSRLLICTRRMRRILRQTREPNTAESETLARLLPRENSGAATIRVSPLDVVPFFTGLWHPRIVIPQRLLSELSDKELGMVLDHEQAHARHRDQWVAVLQQLTLAVHWWNPLVWSLNHQLTASREMLCDYAVTREKPASFADTYSRLLVTMTETLTRAPLQSCVFALAATSSFKNLRQRIVWLKNATTHGHRGPSRWLIAASCLLAVGSLLIASCDNTPNEKLEMIELSEVDKKIQSGEITFKTIFSQLEAPAIDPAMELPGRDIFLTTKIVEKEPDDASDPGAEIEVEHDVREPQIYITSKFIESETKLDAEIPTYAVISDAEFQLLIRLLNQRKGVDLLSAPSVMARNTQTAKIEVVNAIPLPSPPDFQNQKATDSEITATVHTGVILEVTPTIKRGQIYLVGKATIRVADRRESDDDDDEQKSLIIATHDGSPAQGALSFNTVETYFSSPIKPGATLLLNCRQTEKQKGSLLIMLTAKLLDAKGAELKME